MLKPTEQFLLQMVSIPFLRDSFYHVTLQRKFFHLKSCDVLGQIIFVSNLTYVHLSIATALQKLYFIHKCLSFFESLRHFSITTVCLILEWVFFTNQGVTVALLGFIDMNM